MVWTKRSFILLKLYLADLAEQVMLVV